MAAGEKMPGQKKRKREYIAGLAQLNFTIEFDWSKEEAKAMYDTAVPKVEKDTILYEDCIAGMNKMPEESVDLIIADPPFGIEFSGKGSQYNRKPDLVEEGYVEIGEEYSTFTEKWVKCLSRIMKPAASAYLLSGWTNLNDLLNAIKQTNLILVNHIIWKYQFGVFTKRKFVSSHYHVLFLVKNENDYFFNKCEQYAEDVWIIPRNYMPGQKKNGTKLPEDLIIKCINFSSRPGDIIFDPFMGNATTAVCAKGLYRHYHGFELNEKMKGIHEENLGSVKAGAFYKPLKEYLPSVEELVEKYPHLKKLVQKGATNTKKDATALDSFLQK
nr:site-specific DNA-methyltransferase [Candidatus Sigynarchaeota archaeon]